jgi:hypothetical protein
MGKALVIAEKPSVALDLSRALGRFTKKDDFFENAFPTSWTKNAANGVSKTCRSFRRSSN